MTDPDSIRKELEKLADEELLAILRDRDEERWRPEAFVAAASILESRGVAADKIIVIDAEASEQAETHEFVSGDELPRCSESRKPRRIFRSILKFSGAAFLALIVLALLWSIAGFFIANRLEKSLRERWLQTTGWSEKDLYESRPGTKDVVRNETARELEALGDRLGIGFHLRSVRPHFLGYQGKKWGEIVKDSGVSQNFIDYQLSLPEDSIDAMPPEISRYVTEHGKEIEKVYQVPLSGDPPVGELPEESARYLKDHKFEFDDLYYAVTVGQDSVSRSLLEWPFSLNRLLFLQKLIALDVLEKTRQGREQDAIEGMNASWKLGEALRSVPMPVSQTISGYLAYYNAKLIRKMNGVPEEWQKRLASHSYSRSALRNYAVRDVVGRDLVNSVGLSGGLFLGRSWSFNGIMSSAVVRPYLRICLYNNSSALNELVNRLLTIDVHYYGKVEIPKEYPGGSSSWNVLPVYLKKPFDPDLFDSWERGIVIDLNQELSQKVLRLKAARAAGRKLPDPEESIVCKGSRWTYAAQVDGSASVHLDTVPEWIEKTRVNLSYRLRAPGITKTTEVEASPGLRDSEAGRTASPAHMDPLITNETKSLRIISIEKSADSIDLLIRNMSGKNAMVVYLSDGQGRFSGAGSLSKPDALIPAGGTFFRRNEFRSGPGSRITLNTVVFEDGTFEGNRRIAIRRLAKADGAKMQALFLLQMVLHALEAKDADLSARMDQLEADLNKMHEAVERQAAIKLMRERYGGVKDASINELYLEFESGFYEVRNTALSGVADARRLTKEGPGSENLRMSIARGRLTDVKEELEGIIGARQESASERHP